MSNKTDVLDQLIAPNGPTVLVIKARLAPVGEQDRFQPASFPEIGHVIYDAPRGNCQREKVCIVDSPASMANHLEAVCLAEDDPTGYNLHKDLKGLPYVACVTDRSYKIQGSKIITNPKDPCDKLVATTFTEGHRLASDYFLDGKLNLDGNKKVFRDALREKFGVEVLKPASSKNAKSKPVYYFPPESWWRIYKTIFEYDPNSLVHGVMFAKEQIKIPRFLTAHLEAFGASRVVRSGVKFDRLGKTLSGQPIFAVDEETAYEIRATFILDLAWLRSLGTGDSTNANGLTVTQKKLLLCFAFWKINALISKPWRYRTQCYLKAVGQPSIKVESGREVFEHTFESLLGFDISQLITDSYAGDKREDRVTRVCYSADELFKIGKEEDKQKASGGQGAEDEVEDEEGDESPEEEQE